MSHPGNINVGPTQLPFELKRFAVVDPGSGTEWTSCPDCIPADVDNAVQSSHAAFQTYSRMNPRKRAQLLNAWHNLIVASRDDLAKILVHETGKPLAEAYGEIDYGTTFTWWFTGEADRIQGSTLVSAANNRRTITIKQPIGVAVALVPWNFPIALVLRKVSAALAAGCTILVKPSPETPVTALCLAELATRAGFPNGVFNILTTSLENTPTVSESLCTHPLVKKVTFTGSTRVGKIVNRLCAENLKKATLELGGNCPFIVFEDGDLDLAINDLFALKWRHAGQACITANRVYVHRDIYEAFINRVVERTKSLVVGHGMSPKTTMGPVTVSRTLDRLEALVSDAVSKGAKMVLGRGLRLSKEDAGSQDDSLLNGYYMQPTILVDVTDDMDMSHEEVFGPVLGISQFSSEEEVTDLANNTPYGLAGYIFTDNVHRSWRMMENLEAGMIALNAGNSSAAEAPFGGMKDSGIGKESGKDVALEMTEATTTTTTEAATTTVIGDEVHGMDAILKIHRTPFNELPNPFRVWNAPPNSHAEGLGRLVILTQDIVKAAASCIRTGRRVSLSWDMNKLEVANFNRQPAQHHVLPIMDGIAFDDLYIINPQQSSQWDGLRHFAAPSPTSENPSRRMFYGGMSGTEIMDRSSTRLGLQHWAKEGICGRGVLLDYVEYAARHGIKYSTFSDHSIPLEVLKDIAREQQMEFRFGDILFIRIGVTREWDTQMTLEDKAAYGRTNEPQHAGVQGTEEMLRWIWDTGFAAVASDAVSFELYPPKESYLQSDGDSVKSVFMHGVLLAGWGVPIGELFDLEGLARICQQENRWEFFVTSAPLNMPGGRFLHDGPGQRKKAHEFSPATKSPDHARSKSADLELVQAKESLNDALVVQIDNCGALQLTPTEIDSIDICAPDIEKTKAAIDNFERFVYAQYLRGAPRPNLLSGVLRLNAIHAFWKNIDILGQKEEHHVDDAISQFCRIGPCLIDVSTLPPSLQPTELQCTIPHHPWFDIIPSPQMRDNLIRAGDTFDDAQLCHDMCGYQSAITGRRGIIVWGTSWDGSCWELTEDFLKRWGWTVRNSMVNAVQFRGSENGIVREVNALPPIKDEDVLIRVTHSGLCGSDILALKQPMVLGHEGVGIIEEAGPGVTLFKKGDRVGWGAVNKTCDLCEFCHSGRDAYCLDRALYFVTDQETGGSICSHAIRNQRWIFRIPDALASEDAAPLMCGGATVWSPLIEHCKAYDRIGIVGMGGLGHMAIQYAKKMGCEVVVFSSTDNKRQEALDLGASEFYATKDVADFSTLGIKPLDRLLFSGSAKSDLAIFYPILSHSATIIFLSVDMGEIALPYSPTVLLGHKVVGSLVCSHFLQEKAIDFAARNDIHVIIEKFPMTLEGVKACAGKLASGKMRYRGVLAWDYS
ncbi:succinate semialdehyde dehydrogenase, putative [Paecilomyces variotii No. 5]|uniref:Succinate semialdehyde dehydrogenase, putative n=1 Tax=Byssochlamys spectabilis (strain No. 5 / NBRC 109023) TaxID=1356009 RepID=V5HRN1_BYSSN|nr:succinate semialdehyde dehydrogenase, putative [Paecilomyces variotii No. 5]